MKANRNMRKNEEAVSPVIGVILMVAITVILAAVIGAFVFGMGPPESAPQASLRASNYTANSFTIEHQGGDEIDTNTTSTKMLIQGIETTSQDSPDFKATGGTKFTVGERINVINVTLASGDTITLVDVGSQKPIASFTVRF